MKRPPKRVTSTERLNASGKRRRRSQRRLDRSRSLTMSHHYVAHPQTPQGENMYVVWTGDGKPVTVIKAKRASTGGIKSGSKPGATTYPGFGVNSTQQQAPPGGDSERQLVRTLSSPPKLGRPQKPK